MMGGNVTDKTPKGSSNWEATAVVIGGGFSGLSSAAELSSNRKIKVTLVEAADYLVYLVKTGGRVKQVTPFEGCQFLDVGGEFVHGENTTAVELARKFSWNYQDADNDFQSKSYCYIGGKLLPMDESNQLFVHGRNICEAFIENGRVIRRRFPLTGCSSEPLFSTLSSSHDGCDSLTPGKSDDVASLKDLSMHEFIENLNGLDSACKELLDIFYCQTEGNDINRIGMLEFSRAEDSWIYGSKNFRLKHSYRNLVNNFIERCKAQDVDIRLNWEVTKVKWSDDKLSCVSNKENEELFCDFVVITVPLQVLKEGKIEFYPDILPYKRNVFDCMEMRSGCKIFCCFSKRFWPSNLQCLYVGKPSMFTQVWSEDSFVHDDKTFHVLCGFSTASAADKIAKCMNDEIKLRFLGQLDMIFRCKEDVSPATNSFVDYFFYDWGSNPFVKGCYASPVVDSYRMAENLARPIKDRLFFAGEATNTRGMSTVQSAIDSGKRVAKEILTLFEKQIRNDCSS